MFNNSFSNAPIAATNENTKVFYVVHPLDDVHEAKPDLSHLGRMPMTRTVKYSLRVLQVYLVAMVSLVAYHVYMLAGAI